MSYLVFCVFDLKGAHREDRLYAYMDLATLGLRKVVKADSGPNFKLPASAVMGMFDGASVEDVRSAIGKKVEGLFKARGLHANFFVIVSSEWACAGEST